jgi:hypothetical protein
MKLISTVIMAAIVLGTFLGLTTGCDKFNLNLPGNVAGQILNEGGQGQGFVSVHLVSTDGAEMVETSSDTGNYMFKEVKPGTYIIKTFAIGGAELPNDAVEFKLGPGKTATQNIKVTTPVKDESESQ